MDKSVIKISEPISRLYEDLVPGEAPVAVQDTLNQVVKFAMQDDENNTYCIYSAREAQGRPPGWTRHILEETPTAFASLSNVEYYGSASGLIHKMVRGTWNDNGIPVTGTMIARPTDFGAPGQRKALKGFRVRFRNGLKGVGRDLLIEGTQCYIATELTQNYEDSDRFKLASRVARDNLSDRYKSRVESIGFSCPIPKAIFYQLKIENTSDEPLEITGIDYRVSGLDSGRGMKDANETQE
jgi:hypothetical protein